MIICVLKKYTRRTDAQWGGMSQHNKNLIKKKSKINVELYEGATEGANGAKGRRHKTEGVVCELLPFILIRQ